MWRPFPENQNKYCRYHKDVGHTTEECITFKDKIEKLICRGYLQDYINGRRARPQNHAPEAEPLHEIWTIFGGPHFTGETCGAQERYVREMKSRPLTNVHSVDKWPAKQYKGENDNITFKESDAHLIHHPHHDALVIKAMMANNNVYGILVDNGSSVDILYYQAFQRMGLRDNDLRPSPNPIYRFTGDSVVPVGVITLPLTIGEYPRERDGGLLGDQSTIGLQCSTWQAIVEGIKGGH